MGIKAVAIYRDNCKVGQPLSTTKKAARGGGGRRLRPAGVRGRGPDRAAAARIAELEAALAHAQSRSRDTVVVGAVRERLPRRRKSSTFAFRVADCEGYVTVGEYDDGRPGEVFMKVSKQGSTLAGIMDAFSISVSLGLQHGVPLATYVRKYTQHALRAGGDHRRPGPAHRHQPAWTTSSAGWPSTTCPLDEREDLGVLSTSERMQPTLPGVEEAATPEQDLVEDAGVSSVPPSGLDDRAPTWPASPSASGSAPARAEQSNAPLCYQCGMVMQRAGSCYLCTSCGTTSGCS